ncbi:MAG: hypothetical protein JXR63_05845 [Spirochaetales bacterium]|nr:hypothetical protein [Spirochaetales bacterium]
MIKKKNLVFVIPLLTVVLGFTFLIVNSGFKSLPSLDKVAPVNLEEFEGLGDKFQSVSVSKYEVVRLLTYPVVTSPVQEPEIVEAPKEIQIGFDKSYKYTGYMKYEGIDRYYFKINNRILSWSVGEIVDGVELIEIADLKFVFKQGERVFYVQK